MRPPVATEFIDAAEAKLGVRLPQSYRDAMKARNGAYLELHDDVWEVLPVWDTSTTKRAARTCNDFARETLQLRELEWFPTGAVAIAVCNTDRIVLLPSPDDPTRLGETCFLWYFDEDGVREVAASFAELVEGAA